MPFFVLVSGDLVEVDRRTYKTLVDDGNRRFELTEDNPNAEFANVYWEFFEAYGYDESKRFYVVVSAEEADYQKRRRGRKRGRR